MVTYVAKLPRRGLMARNNLGVPINDIFEHLDATIAQATPLYELCASVLESPPP
jgi:hypothetical protein